MFDNMIKLVNDEMSSQKECNSYSVFTKTFSLLSKSAENANERKAEKKGMEMIFYLSHVLYFFTRLIFCFMDEWDDKRDGVKDNFFSI